MAIPCIYPTHFVRIYSTFTSHTDDCISLYLYAPLEDSARQGQRIRADTSPAACDEEHWQLPLDVPVYRLRRVRYSTSRAGYCEEEASRV